MWYYISKDASGLSGSRHGIGNNESKFRWLKTTALLFHPPHTFLQYIDSVSQHITADLDSALQSLTFRIDSTPSPFQIKQLSSTCLKNSPTPTSRPTLQRRTCTWSFTIRSTTPPASSTSIRKCRRLFNTMLDTQGRREKMRRELGYVCCPLRTDVDSCQIRTMPCTSFARTLLLVFTIKLV
jgi:hypothetical protein